MGSEQTVNPVSTVAAPSAYTGSAEWKGGGPQEIALIVVYVPLKDGKAVLWGLVKAVLQGLSHSVS